ncbi:uncharacterized protein PV09_05423 [Verruconis gallopava]|uniref:Aminotransferase class I/classII large domain-containing protein n=1 Tax=Verruconis gallopava TaxID=253628 RepID=A0A0D1YRG1_9PEZI|nr:uncharacterized protein PV09_05423 [Verruconis gallopava]KIW03197.1 hypothetical protein PV09_05423 [Verruconis gallopava]
MDEVSPQNSLEKALAKRLEERLANSKFRKLTVAAPGSVDFSSNDFLSLSTSSTLRSAFVDELSRHPNFPLGSGGSRLLDGNSQYALDLENEIVSFHGASAGLLWNSGFDANSGFFACVPQPGDIILYDELIHASVHDGMKLSRAGRKIAFKHNSVDHLRKTVQALKEEDVYVGKGPKNVFVAVESVYSMDGDLCPLKELVECIEEALPYGNGHIVVDEAHATGVIGPLGRGLVSQLGLEKKVFARLHTFGKGLGTSGAILLCSPIVRSYLINYARPLIFTTSMPFINLAAIKASYSLLQSGVTEPLVSHLQMLTSHLHTQLLRMLIRYTRPYESINDTLHVSPLRPQSPIFALLTKHPRSLAAHCQNAGFVVRAVVPPTVPTRRVRVCLHAGNTVDEVDRLVRSIESWVRDRIGVASSPAVEELEKARL